MEGFVLGLILGLVVLALLVGFAVMRARRR